VFESSKKDVLSSFQLDPELTEPHRLIKHEKLELYLQDNPLCSDVDSTLDSKMAGAHYFSLSSISSKVIQ
jgi:hypothetical protein